MEQTDYLCCLGIIVAYYIIGAVVYGIMHRYDPYWFFNDATHVGFVVCAWIILVPLYWFWIFCDRCICWFERKEE